MSNESGGYFGSNSAEEQPLDSGSYAEYWRDRCYEKEAELKSWETAESHSASRLEEVLCENIQLRDAMHKISLG